MLSGAIGVVFSLVAFVSVTIVTVFLVRNSAKIKTLNEKTSLHEDDFVKQTAIQNKTVKNLVDSVNYNDLVVNRENTRLNRYVKNVELDANTKMDNLDENMDILRNRTDSNLKILDENMRRNIGIVDEKTHELDHLRDDLEQRHDKRLRDNHQFTKDATHSNYDYINKLDNDIKRIINSNDSRYDDRFDGIDANITAHGTRLSAAEEDIHRIDRDYAANFQDMQMTITSNNDVSVTNNQIINQDIGGLRYALSNKVDINDDQYVRYDASDRHPDRHGLMYYVNDLESKIDERHKISEFNNFKMSDFDRLERDVVANAERLDNLSSNVDGIGGRREQAIDGIRTEIKTSMDFTNNAPLSSTYLKKNDLNTNLESLKTTDNGNVIYDLNSRLEGNNGALTRIKESYIYNDMLNKSTFDEYFNTTQGRTDINANKSAIETLRTDHESLSSSISDNLQRITDINSQLGTIGDNIAANKDALTGYVTTGMLNDYYNKSAVDSKINGIEDGVKDKLKNDASFKNEIKGERGVSVSGIEPRDDGTGNKFIQFKGDDGNNIGNELQLPRGPNGLDGNKGDKGDNGDSLTELTFQERSDGKAYLQQTITNYAGVSTTTPVSPQIDLKGPKGNDANFDNLALVISDGTLCLKDNTTNSENCLDKSSFENLIYTKTEYEPLNR